MAHGLCRAAVDATARHLSATGFEHTGTQLRDLPKLRARLAADERAHRGVARAARPHARRDGGGVARGAALRAVGAAGRARGGARGHRPGAEGLRRRRVLAPGDAHRAPLPRRARRLGDGADRRSPRRLHRQGPDRPARCSRRTDGRLASCSAPSPTTPRSSRSGRASATTSATPASTSTSRSSPTTSGRSRSCSPGTSTSPGTRRSAHVRVRKRTEGRSLSLGMRDSDRDFHAKVIVRADAGIRSLADLAGKTLAVGSRDSTQARILPLHFLRQEGVDLDAGDAAPVRHRPRQARRHRHERARRAARASPTGARRRARSGDLVWVTEQAAGRVDANAVEVLWTTPGFDHCMFDALPDARRVPGPRVPGRALRDELGGARAPAAARARGAPAVDAAARGGLREPAPRRSTRAARLVSARGRWRSTAATCRSAAACSRWCGPRSLAWRRGAWSPCARRRRGVRAGPAVLVPRRAARVPGLRAAIPTGATVT